MRIDRSILVSCLPPKLRLTLRARWRQVFDPVEIDCLRWLCDPGRAAIDVGANVGIYAYFLRRYARRCHAVEPHPQLAALLRQSLPPDVDVIECALSERQGEATLSVPSIDGKAMAALATIDTLNRSVICDGAQSVTVATRRLDDLGLGPVGLIKIDVEGHEGAVLRGAERTIETHRPAILVEAEERHHPGAVANLRAFMEAKSYRGYFFLGRKLQPVETFDPGRHQSPQNISRDGRRLGGVYVNNFIYVGEPAMIDRLDDRSMATPFSRKA